MDNKEIIAGALGACKNDVQVEDVFSRFGVTDYGDRIDCLNECMGNPKTFYSGGEETPDDIKYEITLGMFCAGAWRIALSVCAD